jgi:restriction system protein
MPVPTYDQFIEPILRYLATKPDGAPTRDVYDAAAVALGLTDADRAEILPSGIQPVYQNRAGWAHNRLKRAGLSSSVRRGYWKLTDRGREFVAANPAPLPEEEIERLADVRNAPELRPPPTPPGTTTPPPVSPVSPDDRLEAALVELRENVAGDLLEALAQVTPQRFETIVLDLLHRMGYGTTREDLQRVGRSGDGGIDGVISLDRLGLEKVYVQAKRWQSSVGRPDVQGFYGALAGQRANKGVFITTSAFTQQAIDFARSVERLVLVDGEKLAALMTEHEVGVTLRPVRVPKLDSDYFDE